MKNIILTALFSYLFLLASCQNNNNSTFKGNGGEKVNHEQFNNYWYSGKAEVVAYNLRQSRYGEVHNGKAVLIFVTEPFSASKHVKLDHPGSGNADKVTVMKLNFTKKFLTGIYPYSMMFSAFTPIYNQEYPKTLKLTMSAQEWCGHAYSQLNLDDGKYDVRSFSYFEQEGDEQFKLDATLLEDEIWTLIRLGYQSLPVGDINIIPGLFYSRLMHRDLELLPASAHLEEKDGQATYKINYPERTLSITFETTFPYTINSWEEIYEGYGGAQLKTSATFDRMLHIDYWTKNKKAYQYLRDTLHLND